MLSEFITWNADPMLVDSFIRIRWYGLMFAIGFWLGLNIVSKMFKHEGAPERWLGILLIWVVGATIIGARLGHVFFYEWGYYSQHPAEIIAFWKGGLASHGGTIAIIIAVLLFSWVTTKRSPLWTFDRLVIPIALVGALIRLGNLFNSEIYGHATDLPWGFIFVRNGEILPHHPTQLYEATAYFALFGLLMWMYWKRNDEERPGLIFGTFLTLLFTARFLIEYVKEVQVDWETDMVAHYGINMGQALSIPFILIGLFFIIRAYMRPRLHLEFPNKFAPEPQNKGKH